MFKSCSILEDISPLENWPITDSKNIRNMFYGAYKINKNILKKWKISEQNYKNAWF